MSALCGRKFDESLLSGYLDGVLTQAQRQEVRLHLEGCQACRELFEELRSLRQVTLDTTFSLPADEQWRETPRTPASRLGRWLGGTLLVVWLAVVLIFGLHELAVSHGPAWQKILGFAGVSGFVFLLLSVLIDRLHDLRTDPYRSVEK